MASVITYLHALLSAWRPGANDPAWRAAADWLEEHPEFQRTPVRRDPRPAGFAEYWHARGYHLRHPRTGGRGRWGEHDIRNALAAHPGPGLEGWFDHGGWTTVGGIPAVVGEPYRTAEGAEATAAALQASFPDCPVTYDRRGAHAGGEARRIVLWFPYAVPGVVRTVRCRRCRRAYVDEGGPDGRCPDCRLPRP